MKKRQFSRDFKKKVIVSFLIFLSIPIFSATYFYSCFDSIMSFEKNLTSAKIDYSSLIPANYTRLAEMADEFEYYLERDHLPLNYTLSVLWDYNFSAIQYHIVSGDAAIWTGMTLAMTSLRYAVIKRENNDARTSDALKLVKRLVHGVSLLLEVPNGGIGPGYPGVLARSVSPKNWTINNPPIISYPYGSSADNINFFDGKGNYSDWFWIGYPSLDQYSGIIMGITLTAALVDDPWVKEQMKMLGSQVLEHLLKLNWYLADGNGRTTGQTFDYKPEHPSYWVLATLFMGSLVDPSRYETLYYHYALERGYADMSVLRSNLNIFSLFNYYSLNINWVILYAMTMLETHPYLKKIYKELLENNVYPLVKYHRNAWFNMAYLNMIHENNTYIQKDVEDQLMRFDIERIPGDENSTRIPERGVNKTGYTKELIPESWPRTTFSKWLKNKPQYPSKELNVLTKLFNADQEYLTRPKTVEYYQSADFLWQRTPWEDNTGSPAIRQDSGLDFLLPYYMGRFQGIIKGP
ncbi:MAG: hypothetical protein ACTSVI_09695 [Promethearchaeota archaeon]